MLARRSRGRFLPAFPWRPVPEKSLGMFTHKMGENTLLDYCVHGQPRSVLPVGIQYSYIYIYITYVIYIYMYNDIYCVCMYIYILCVCFCLS